jgi:hypothetical protein
MAESFNTTNFNGFSSTVGTTGYNPCVTTSYTLSNYMTTNEKAHLLKTLDEIMGNDDALDAIILEKMTEIVKSLNVN